MKIEILPTTAAANPDPGCPKFEHSQDQQDASFFAVMGRAAADMRQSNNAEKETSARKVTGDNDEQDNDRAVTVPAAYHSTSDIEPREHRAAAIAPRASAPGGARVPTASREHSTISLPPDAQDEGRAAGSDGIPAAPQPQYAPESPLQTGGNPPDSADGGLCPPLSHAAEVPDPAQAMSGREPAGDATIPAAAPDASKAEIEAGKAANAESRTGETRDVPPAIQADAHPQGPAGSAASASSQTSLRADLSASARSTEILPVAAQDSPHADAEAARQMLQTPTENALSASAGKASSPAGAAGLRENQPDIDFTKSPEAFADPEISVVMAGGTGGDRGQEQERLGKAAPASAGNRLPENSAAPAQSASATVMSESNAGSGVEASPNAGRTAMGGEKTLPSFHCVLPGTYAVVSESGSPDTSAGSSAGPGTPASPSAARESNAAADILNQGGPPRDGHVGNQPVAAESGFAKDNGAAVTAAVSAAGVTEVSGAGSTGEIHRQEVPPAVPSEPAAKLADFQPPVSSQDSVDPLPVEGPLQESDATAPAPVFDKAKGFPEEAVDPSADEPAAARAFALSDENAGLQATPRPGMDAKPGLDAPQGATEMPESAAAAIPRAEPAMEMSTAPLRAAAATSTGQNNAIGEIRGAEDSANRKTSKDGRVSRQIKGSTEPGIRSRASALPAAAGIVKSAAPQPDSAGADVDANPSAETGPVPADAASDDEGAASGKRMKDAPTILDAAEFAWADSQNAQRMLFHGASARASSSDVPAFAAIRPFQQAASISSTMWSASLPGSPQAAGTDLKDMLALLAPKAAGPSQMPEFLSQLSERISSQLRNNESILRIQLKPGTLGRMEIKAETSASGVVATILTESASVKNYLEHNLHQLQQSFQDQGLKIDRINVLVNQESWAQSSSSGQQQSSTGTSHHGESRSAGSGGGRLEQTSEEIALDAQTLSFLSPHSTFHTIA